MVAHFLEHTDPVHKISIISRGQALGYTISLPTEDKFLTTRAELADTLAMTLGGRAAEEIAFSEITTGAANDLEKVTEIARSMVFEWGMADSVSSRTLRADNYALSEATKSLRDQEQARLTDSAYAEAVRLLQKHRAPLDKLAASLLDRETLLRDEVVALLADVGSESRASESVGVPQVVAASQHSS
jgi:cell division protease FtsH